MITRIIPKLGLNSSKKSKRSIACLLNINENEKMETNLHEDFICLLLTHFEKMQSEVRDYPDEMPQKQDRGICF